MWSVKIDILTGATIVVTLAEFDADVFLAPDSRIMDSIHGSLREQPRRVMKFSCDLLQPATRMSIEI